MFPKHSAFSTSPEAQEYLEGVRKHALKVPEKPQPDAVDQRIAKAIEEYDVHRQEAQ